MSVRTPLSSVLFVGLATLASAAPGDGTPPQVEILSPSAEPRPGLAYPANVHRYAPGLAESDLPLPIDVLSHDEDGHPGGVVAQRVRLDGRVLDLELWRAAKAAENPSLSPFPADHAFVFEHLPGGPSFVWENDEQAPRFHRFDGGAAALLRGIIASNQDSTQRWQVELWLRPAAAPLGGPLLELYSEQYLPAGPIDPETWGYWALDPAKTSTLTGLGAQQGVELELVPDGATPFAFGLGANGRGLDLGFAGPLATVGSFSGPGKVLLALRDPALELTEGVFRYLDLEMLGPHTLEVEAFDEAGNRGAHAVDFELVLYVKVGMLFLERAELYDAAVATPAAYSLMTTPSRTSAGYGIADVIPTTLSLRSEASGRSVAPQPVSYDAAEDSLVMFIDRAALADPSGALGTRFSLTGRLGSPEGPRFLAEDEPLSALERVGLSRLSVSATAVPEPVRARVLGRFGLPVADIPAELELAGVVYRAVSDVAGELSFALEALEPGDHVGELRVPGAGLSLSVSVSVEEPTPSGPVLIALAGGADQSIPAGQRPAFLRVRVLEEAGGAPLAGVFVEQEVFDAAGSRVSVLRARTNGAGEASILGRPIGTPGVYEVRVHLFGQGGGFRYTVTVE